MEATSAGGRRTGTMPRSSDAWHREPRRARGQGDGEEEGGEAGDGGSAAAACAAAAAGMADGAERVTRADQTACRARMW